MAGFLPWTSSVSCTLPSPLVWHCGTLDGAMPTLQGWGRQEAPQPSPPLTCQGPSCVCHTCEQDRGREQGLVTGGPPTQGQPWGPREGARLGEPCMGGECNFLFKQGPAVLTKQKAGTGWGQVLDVDRNAAVEKRKGVTTGRLPPP